MNALKEMHYQFYEHTLPNINQEEKELQSVSAAAKSGEAVLPGGAANPGGKKWLFVIPLLLLIL